MSNAEKHRYSNNKLVKRLERNTGRAISITHTAEIMVSILLLIAFLLTASSLK